MKKLIPLFVAALLATPVIAQQPYPGPTYSNVTIQGNIIHQSQPDNKFVAIANDGSKQQVARDITEVDLPAITVAKITGLQAALDTKSNVGHTHPASDIASGTLSTARIPALAISQTTGLQAALDAKAALAHVHSADDITSGVLADARIPSLAVSKITGLQTIIDGKAGVTHVHSGVDITSGTVADARLPSTMSAKTINDSISITGAPGVAPSILLNRSNVPRWNFGLTTGDDFFFNSQNNDGSYKASILGISRSTGVANFSYSPTAPTPGSSDDSTKLATTAWVRGYTLPSGAPANMVTTDTAQTITGPKTFYGDTISDAPTGVGHGVILSSGGAYRWNYGINSTADFYMNSQNDDGSYRSSVLGINRANGVVSFGSSPTAPVPSRGDNTSKVPTTSWVAANKGTTNPRDFGAACNGTTDDTAAYNSARTAAFIGALIVVDCPLGISQGTNIDHMTLVTYQGKFVINSGGSVGIDNVSLIQARSSQRIFDGPNYWAVYTGDAAGTFSVCWIGACTGVADVAKNLRAMFNNFGNNKTYEFPAGNYNLCSSIPAGTGTYNASNEGSGQVGYNATNQSSVIIKQRNNITVKANIQANFTTCAAIAQNIAFLIDRTNGLRWDGGSFYGSRSGLSTAAVNAPFQLMNNTDIQVRNVHAVQGYTDAGAFFEGDGNTDFTIENNVGTVGQCVDMAFSVNAIYRNNKCYGASTDGNNIGLKAFSHIYDGPIISGSQTNNTASTNVQVLNNRFENYISGVVIQEGQHWKVHDNNLINIKGLGSSPGTPVLINYQPTGSFANVGHVPWDITIQGNHVDGMGTNVAGCFVNIGANAIANGDVFNDIFINGNMIAGAAGSTGVCADTTSSAKIANLFVGINAYRNIGALMNANASSIAKPAGLAR